MRTSDHLGRGHHFSILFTIHRYEKAGMKVVLPGFVAHRELLIWSFTHDSFLDLPLIVI